jgi:hypothetical protein
VPPDIAALPPAERPNLLFSKYFGPRRAEPTLSDLEDSAMRLAAERVRDEIAAMPSPGTVAEELGRRYG